MPKKSTYDNANSRNTKAEVKLYFVEAMKSGIFQNVTHVDIDPQIANERAETVVHEILEKLVISGPKGIFRLRIVETNPKIDSYDDEATIVQTRYQCKGCKVLYRKFIDASDCCNEVESDIELGVVR